MPLMKSAVKKSEGSKLIWFAIQKKMNYQEMYKIKLAQKSTLTA